MPRKRDLFPVPHINFRGTTAKIRWSFHRKMYEFSCGDFPLETPEYLCSLVARALRSGEWPSGTALDLSALAAVRRYRSDCGDVPADDEVMARFADFLSAGTSAARRDEVLAHVGELGTWCKKPPSACTHDDIARYLANLGESITPRHRAHWIYLALADGPATVAVVRERMLALGADEALCTHDGIYQSIAASDRVKRCGTVDRCGVWKLLEKRGASVSTVNKRIVSIRRFFVWAEARGIVARAPSDGFRQRVVQESGAIVALSREERLRVLLAARGLSGGDRLAVWIALYAGLRLKEIGRLEWSDVDLARRWLHVRAGKTGRVRDVPLAPKLARRLDAVPRKQRTGRVSRWCDGPDGDWREPGRIVREVRRASVVQAFGWNVCRHTFCSMLAQRGRVTIDQIAAISGHTPAVCRRYYARLVPADVAATGIDLI